MEVSDVIAVVDVPKVASFVAVRKVLAVVGRSVQRLVDVRHVMDQHPQHERPCETILRIRGQAISQSVLRLVEAPDNVVLILVSFTVPVLLDDWNVVEMPVVEGRPAKSFDVISPGGCLHRKVLVFFAPRTQNVQIFINLRDDLRVLSEQLLHGDLGHDHVPC